MVKRPSDPNGPKKPLSTFMAWRADNIQRITKTMPVGHSFKELQTKVGVEWKALTEDAKKPYVDANLKANEKYKKLFSAYKQTTSYKTFQKTKAQFQVDEVKKTKFRKDENAPKKPLSGYFLFLEERRPIVKKDHPDLPHKELVKKLGVQWSELSAADKKPFEDKAVLAKKNYQVKFAKYQQSEEYKTYQEEKAEFMKSKKLKLSAVKKRSRKDDSEDEVDQPKVKKAKKAKKHSSPKKSAKKAKKSSKSKPKAPKSTARRVARKAKPVKAAKAKASKSKQRKGKKSSKKSK